METLSKAEKARRAATIQVFGEGGTIESCLRDIPESDIEEMDEEQINLACAWKVDHNPNWDFEIRDFRIVEKKVEFWGNLILVSAGKFTTQCYGSKIEAEESSFDGVYRTAVKLIEAPIEE